jgi:hypothetical protein
VSGLGLVRVGLRFERLSTFIWGRRAGVAGNIENEDKEQGRPRGWTHVTLPAYLIKRRKLGHFVRTAWKWWHVTEVSQGSREYQSKRVGNE